MTSLPPAYEILRKLGIRFVVGKPEFPSNCPKCGHQTSNWIELHDDAVCCHCQNQNCDFAKIVPLPPASARPAAAAAAADGKANAAAGAAKPQAGADDRAFREARAVFTDDDEAPAAPGDGGGQAGQTAEGEPGTSIIDATLAVFDKWLVLADNKPVLAVLGAVAANYLSGPEPVWLGVVAPPSSAKTELLNSIAALPNVEPIATLTEAALLSGTPQNLQAKGAKGGLLRQIGNFGIVSLKDFGSILSMHTETRAQVLAALREIFDGKWVRRLGTDGGKTLEWAGKLGLVFGCTPAIDAYHAVIGSLGDRWLLSRMAPVAGKRQFIHALKHGGAALVQMRKELAEAVAALFASRKAEPRAITDDEANRIGDAISLAVRLRGTVERDRRTREVEAVYGAEGTARIGLSLAKLLDGLDMLRVDRETAMEVVLSIALDSVPPVRRQAYEAVLKFDDLTKYPSGPAETKDIALELGLPTTTVRRALEELTAYGLVDRRKKLKKGDDGGQEEGRIDLWVKAFWER